MDTSGNTITITDKQEMHRKLKLGEEGRTEDCLRLDI